MIITNMTRQVKLADRATVAASHFQRMKGLLGRTGLVSGEALILKPCGSVHTCFMRFTIDVIFVDRHNRVVKALSRMAPGRMSGIYFTASFCIELPEGTIESTATQIGDLLSFFPSL